MKYLMIVIEYFTKWIEAEPVAQIITHKVQHFVLKNIVCRYGVPNVRIYGLKREGGGVNCLRNIFVHF